MKIYQKVTGIFMVGSGLTFIEMFVIYASLNYPAILSIVLFIIFSLFNGYIFMEAIENADRWSKRRF